MKLIKCYVENFGNLHQYEYIFNENLNIIKENNGFGKTTFATFIKSMFYGLDSGVKVKTENSERKKYMPWQGGNYGGYVEFEINDKTYRVERFFGKKKNDDTFKLYDLSTNLESFDYTENLGEEIFQINKSAYERSTYIPQGQIQINMEDSLSAKLGNVLESDNDINTSDEAIKRLNETKKIYKKDRGKGGLIDSKIERLYDLERSLENRKSDMEVLQNRIQKLEEKNAEIKQVELEREKTQKLLTQKIEADRKKAKLETYQNLLKNYKEYEEKNEVLNKFFAGKIPEDSFLKDLENKNYEFEKSKAEINASKLSEEENNAIEKLTSKFTEHNITEKMIDERIVDYDKLQGLENDIREKRGEKEHLENDLGNRRQEIERKSKNSKIFLIIGIILIIVGIGASNFIIIGVGIALVIAFFVMKKSSQFDSSAIEEKINNLASEIEVLENSKNIIQTETSRLLELTNSKEENILVELTNLKAEISNYFELLNKQKQKNIYMQNALSKKNDLESELQEALMLYFPHIDKSYMELIQELKMKKSELENIKKQFETVKLEKEKYESENDVSLLDEEEKISDISEEDIKQKNNELIEKMDKLIDEKNQLKNSIEILENRLDEYEFLENDIENLKNEIEELNEKYKILSKTEEFLKIAKEQFSSSYLQDMVNGFNKYLEIINNNSMQTNVDINLNVKIETNGKQKEIKYFSAGYQDLIYICMRLSLIKALFKEELPFVVLDDPLVNLDEEKIAKALDVIKEFTKQYQIIYFVCHESRVVEEENNE